MERLYNILPVTTPKSLFFPCFHPNRLSITTLAVFLLVSTFTSVSQIKFLENGGPINRGSDLGFLLDTPLREKIDLSGTWGFSVEGGGSGTVKVPSAYDFVGKVNFDRTFEVTAEQLDMYVFHLVMYGANYNTEVSLNGDFLTNHIGGYTSFVYPVPANVLQVGKENVIRVAVDNRLDPRKTLPIRPGVWGWRNYGGIFRDIFLLATPRLYLDNVVVTSELSPSQNSARVTVVAGVQGVGPEPSPEQLAAKKRPTLGFYVEMFDKVFGFSVARSAIAPLVEEGEEWVAPGITFNVDNPKLWSPEFPELYLVKCFIVRVEGKESTPIDQYDVDFGIRKVEISAGDIILNGRRFVAKGVIWQEDHPLWGSSLTYEEMEKDVVLIKNLGANLIRFGNHPPHPYMLNLCNRYGLMALEELPVVNVPAEVIADEYYRDLAAGMLGEMIRRDRNHPSVLAWGIGDGFESSSQAARPFVEEMVRTAKRLDTRPTYYASRMGTGDVCGDLVDIAAVNVYVKDTKLFKKQLDEWKEKHADRPVMLARFGAEVEQDNRNGYSDPLSYEAQARYYVQHLDVVRSLDYDGAIVWSFNDWKGDRPALTVNTGDPWIHTMGLVSSQREKRVAYDAVRSVFRGEKFVALPIGNHSASAPIIYVLTGLVVLIGAAYFYNVNRRFRENLNRSVMNSYNFFADVRDQRVVSVIHTAVLGVIVSIATAIVVSSMLYHFKESWVLDNLLSYLLITDELKERAVRLIRDPLKFIVYFAAFMFVLLLVISTVVLVMSWAFKARIYAFHAYSITFWATPPLLLLVPVGMILYRVMESPTYVIPAVLLVAVLLAWVLLRLLKGISILFDAYVGKVYVVGILSLVGALALVYLYLDYTQSASIYLTFMFNVMNSQ